MNHVTISLEPEVASAYMNAGHREQKKAETLVNSWLKNIFFRRKDPKQKLFETMDQIGKIAKANGLTPEILEEILQEIKNEKK